MSDLKSRGAEIRVIDLETSSVDQISEHLKDVHTVISALVWSQLDLQKPLIHASKKAGVKRFVPDDWATPCVRGVREYYDQVVPVFDVSLPRLSFLTESSFPRPNQGSWIRIYVHRRWLLVGDCY